MKLGFDLFKLDVDKYVTYGIYTKTCRVCSAKKRDCVLICKHKNRCVYEVLEERGVKNSKKNRKKAGKN